MQELHMKKGKTDAAGEDCSGDNTDAKNLKVAVVGLGWFGCSIAAKLSNLGYKVRAFEAGQNSLPKKESTSAKFGLTRHHRGGHYPTSESTQLGCSKNFWSTIDAARKSNTLREHGCYYALARGLDASGHLSKIDVKKFYKVRLEILKNTTRENTIEDEGMGKIDPEDYEKHGFNKDEIEAVYEIFEPSFKQLEGKQGLRSYLKSTKAEVCCNCKVTKREKIDGKIKLTFEDGNSELFDRVINATGFQSLAS